MYIKEAHADDTWPLGLEHGIQQTQTTAQRCEATCAFLKRTASNPLPAGARILVDAAPANAFDQLFAAWPLRFYVLDHYCASYYASFIGEPRGDLMKIGDLQDYLSIRNLI